MIAQGTIVRPKRAEAWKPHVSNIVSIVNQVLANYCYNLLSQIDPQRAF